MAIQYDSIRRIAACQRWRKLIEVQIVQAISNDHQNVCMFAFSHDRCI